MSETSSSHRPDNCRCDYSYLRQKKSPKFQGESSTHAQFKPYKLQKQPAYEVPKPQVKHYDPDSLQTSYKQQYVKPVLPVNNNNNSDLHMGGSSLMNSYLDKKVKAPFYSQTQYKKTFQPKEIKIQKQPVYQYKPKGTKFQGSTSYKQQFQAKKNQELVSAGHEVLTASNLYKRPQIKFQGESSYKSTFQGHNVFPEKQPQYKYQPKATKFQGQSSYKATFTQLPKQAYKSDLEHCPVHPDRIALK